MASPLRKMSASDFALVRKALDETLNASGPATTCPTLRVSIDDAVGSVLLRWELGLGRRNALMEVPT